MDEFTKVTKEQKLDYYNLKKDQLLKQVELFKESDDLEDLMAVFHYMVVLCRWHGMSLNEVERFIQTQNRESFASIYSFTKVLDFYKKVDKSINNTML